jgi:hypothetical protein
VLSDVLAEEQLKHAYVAFLGDVSGSMHSCNRIDTLKATMREVCKAMPREISFDGKQPQLCLLAAWEDTAKVITLSSGQGVPENWISALEAGGGNNMHQAILAATSMKLDASLTDIIVACDGDTTPFAGVEDWRRFYEGLPKPEKRVHFVAVGSSADKAKMEKFAAVSKGAFLYRG